MVNLFIANGWSAIMEYNYYCFVFVQLTWSSFVFILLSVCLPKIIYDNKVAVNLSLSPRCAPIYSDIRWFVCMSGPRNVFAFLVYVMLGIINVWNIKVATDCWIENLFLLFLQLIYIRFSGAAKIKLKKKILLSEYITQ